MQGSGTDARGALGFAVLGLVAACAAAGGQGPRFVVEHEWAGRGEWVAADLHVHTRFSDGAYPVDRVVAEAKRHGCSALAITDHADRSLRAATPEYRAAIEAARAAHPSLVLLAGLEWNVPPWGGQEHATVLVPPGADEWNVLAAFRDSFDDYELEGRPKPEASPALHWLATKAEAELTPLVIYNHPSRPDAASLENVVDLEAWRAVNDLVIGFEGAPGHQGATPIGSYRYAETPIDRWDPAAARPGDAWDTLLQRGFDLHAALAGSDFHSDGGGLNDYWPCQFSETWLQVPEVTPAGILRALRAGTFFGAHGRIARDVDLTVSAPGLPRPARSGETIRVAGGTVVDVSVEFTAPAVDWEGQPNAIDAVEVFVITSEGVDVRALPAGQGGRRMVTTPVTVGRSGVVVRARGRRAVPAGPALMFYTNAIRVTAG